MEVFLHHIYEYQKGLRNLVLCTLPVHLQASVEAKLEKLGISFLVWPLSSGRINIFFGHHACIEVLQAFGKQTLKDFSPEEDYILGVMLGYDRLQQCRRYLDIKQNRISNFCRSNSSEKLSVAFQ